MMNVHAVLAAKGAIPNVCVRLGGRWGWRGSKHFAPEFLSINYDMISRKWKPWNNLLLSNQNVLKKA